MSTPAPRPALGVLLATGDGALEGRLVTGFAGTGVTIVTRCLDATTLLEAIDATFDAHRPAANRSAGGERIEAVLASTNLHGLTEATLLTLRDRGVPVLLLAADDHQAQAFADLAPAVPASTPADAVAEALHQARAGVLLSGSGPAPRGTQSHEWVAGDDTDQPGSRGRVVVVTSGKGAPGKSTLAIALAAGLGHLHRATAGAVLVDADLRGGNVAPHLDLDPRRGLIALAAASGPLGDRLRDTVQDGPECTVVAGLERPDLVRALPPDLLSGVVARLRERFAVVVVDAGSPPDPALLRAADEVLFVTGADLVSIWNARVALRALGDGLAGRLGVVVNRHEGREHYDAGEIERALGLPVLGVVREDRKAARRAIAAQQPLSAAGGRAAADVRRLATVLAEGAPWASDPHPATAPGAVVVEA